MYDYFTSYARADRDPALETFVKDLKNEVRSKTGLQPEEIEDVWFFDTSSIKTGDDWVDVLGDALCHAKICICLCSPTYFNSHFCGKEFQVFLERRAAHLKAAAHQGQKARVIFPILWELTNGELPETVSKFQDSDDDLPKSYRKDGLRTLKKLKGRRDSYLRCVMEFAIKIRKSLDETQMAPKDGLPPFEEIVSAFAEAAGSAFGVSVLYAGTGGGKWAPFDGGESIASMLASWVGGMKLFYREIPLDVHLSNSLQKAHDSHDTILVVVDPRTVADDPLPAVLAPFRHERNPHADILPVWNETGATTTAEVTALRQNVVKALGPGEWGLIGSGRALKERVDASVARIRGKLLKAAGTERSVADADLKQEAEEDGINPEAQPRIRGPGGGS